MEVGKININFNVFSNSPTHLSITDLSDWVYSEALPSYITILIPGSKIPKTFVFKKFKTNVFNSHNLGLSCFTNDCKEEEYKELPDGIYTACLKSGYEGIEKSQYYLKTDRFEVEYNKVLIRYGTEEVDQKFINLMTKIKYTLDVAKSHTMAGDFVKSNRYFQEAKKLLQEFVECKNCL
jgi:hypothetical protein